MCHAVLCCVLLDGFVRAITWRTLATAKDACKAASVMPLWAEGCGAAAAVENMFSWHTQLLLGHGACYISVYVCYFCFPAGPMLVHQAEKISVAQLQSWQARQAMLCP
jgi:hypothetical protein